MEAFYQYLENALPDKKGNAVLYKFKKGIIDQMVNRANELSARGLKDEKVVSDLVISEYENVIEDYKKYENEQRKAKRRKFMLLANVIGSVAYILVLVIVYLGISFSTQDWATTWVIMVDGILIWVTYLLALIINRVMEMKRIFHFVARILLAISIMVISVAVFIFLLGVFHLPHCWVALFVGLFLMFLSDGIFAICTKQKLAILWWLIYIPAMSAMLYVILGALSVVSWAHGWLMIPLSVIIDLVISLIAIKRNNNYDEEVVDAWKEN